MKFTGSHLQLLDREMMQKLSFQKAEEPLSPDFLSELSKDLSKAKNIVLSGEFCALSENSLKENLLKSKANVQPEITPETEILICGKYPDWMLVEDARHYGIKIMFVDKAGELFGKMATKLIQKKSNFPLEELMEA